MSPRQIPGANTDVTVAVEQEMVGSVAVLAMRRGEKNEVDVGLAGELVASLEAAVARAGCVVTQSAPQKMALCHPLFSAEGHTFTRSPVAADLSMAAMTSWHRTASAKSGTL